MLMPLNTIIFLENVEKSFKNLTNLHIVPNWALSSAWLEHLAFNVDYFKVRRYQGVAGSNPVGPTLSVF